MKYLHPRRYVRQMTRALPQIEDVASLKSTRRDSLLAREFNSLTTRELEAIRGRLNQLEAVVAAWKRDGSLSYDAKFFLADPATAGLMPLPINPADLHPGVTYFEFRNSAGLHLATGGGAFIEGFYVEQSYRDGYAGVELNFVCGVPDWTTIPSGPYGDALRTASKTATCFSPSQMLGCPVSRDGWIGGDPILLEDAVLQRAKRAADIALGTVAVELRARDVSSQDHPSKRPRYH